VGDRRVISRIMYVLRNGLKWRDTPKKYGPYKTLYNRFRVAKEAAGR
jgi:transposase